MSSTTDKTSEIIETSDNDNEELARLRKEGRIGTDARQTRNLGARIDSGQLLITDEGDSLVTVDESMKKPKKTRLTDEERAISELRRKTYLALYNARARCTKPSLPDWPRYGGRGIGFRWETIDDAIRDVGLPPSLSHSLDRRNNDGNYEPGNCHWITKAEQNRNQRKNIWVDVGYGIMIASDADRRLGVPEGTGAAYIKREK